MSHTSSNHFEVPLPDLADSEIQRFFQASIFRFEILNLFLQAKASLYTLFRYPPNCKLQISDLVLQDHTL